MKLDGTFIADYYSISEAGRRTSVNQSNITACCTRKLKQSGGYRFMHSLNIPIVNNLKGNYT